MQMENHTSSAQKILYAIIGIVITVGVLFGVWKMTSKPATPKPTALPLTKEDWVKGKQNAKVILIEYSDFQCPACKAYAPIVKQISKEFNNTIAIVYRHFPLPQHQNAEKAAYVAEAAGAQGKFWEMHDLLFDNQTEWSDKKNPDELLLSYAKELKLDETRFTQDIQSQAVKKKVETDLLSGQTAGVNATPTFFLNGEQFDNPSSFAQFKKKIEEMLNQK